MEAIRMNSVVFFAALLLVVSTVPGQQPADAVDHLRAAQEAMGGTEQLASIRTVSLKGVMRLRNQMYGRDNTAKHAFTESAFVTHALLPDHFIERQDRSYGSSHYAGFATNTLLNRVIFQGRPGQASYPANMIDREHAS